MLLELVSPAPAAESEHNRKAAGKKKKHFFSLE